MINESIEVLQKKERRLILKKALFDGLDRFGATVLALSFIGGLLAPITSAMHPIAACVGAFVGIGTILLFGYLKETNDATLTDVRKVISKKLAVQHDANKAHEKAEEERS